MQISYFVFFPSSAAMDVTTCRNRATGWIQTWRFQSDKARSARVSRHGFAMQSLRCEIQKKEIKSLEIAIRIGTSRRRVC
jgi:hypothetical protein